MRDRFTELTRDVQLDNLELIAPTIYSNHAILERASLISNSFEPILKNIDELGILNGRLLSEVQEDKKTEMQLVVDRTVNSIQSMLEEGRRDLKSFSLIGILIVLTKECKTPGDAKVLQNQKRRLDKDLLEIARSYYQLQTKYKGQKRNQLARNLRIVRSDATSEEIDRILESTSDTAHTLFKQEMLLSTLDSKRTELEMAQQQHTELQKIETSITQLVTMFSDMSQLIKAHDSKIEIIDGAVEEVVTELEAGNQELKKGISYRMQFRRRARIIAAISLVVLIALGVMVYFLAKPTTAVNQPAQNTPTPRVIPPNQ